MSSHEAPTTDLYSGEDVNLRPLVLRANLLDTHRAKLVASLDALVLTLAENIRAKEAARKGVASTVSVDDLLVLQREDVVDLRLRRLRARDDRRRLGAMRDDHSAGARRVRLGECRDGRGDCGEVLLLRVSSGDRPRLGLRLVPDDNVDVGHNLLQLHLEELGNERRGEVQHEDLRGKGRRQGGRADGGRK